MDPYSERFKKALKITRHIKTQTCYHLLMGMAANEGHLTIAVRVKNEMETEGHSSNFKTFNTLYNGCVNSGMANQAEKYLELREQHRDENRHWVVQKPRFMTEKKQWWKMKRKWVTRDSDKLKRTAATKPRLLAD